MRRISAGRRRKGVGAAIGGYTSPGVAVMVQLKL